jgi:probable rRNA maturation factor
MTLCLRNRQRVCPLDLRFLRRIMRHVLQQNFQGGDHELCFHFVEAREIAMLNDKYLGHTGPTDVITFDHGPHGQKWHGEIFICPEVAVAQAKEFRTTWPSEVVRYAIHGLLHLAGYDDLKPMARRKMKREEERVLKDVMKTFAVARLSREEFR